MTLDEDVDLELRAAARRSGQSFKEFVNELLRRALHAPQGSGPRVPFEVRARPMGLRPGLSYDQTAELLEQIEGPSHR